MAEGFVGIKTDLAKQARSAQFGLLAIAAHCVPLSTLALLWEPLMASPIAAAIPLNFAIHGGRIATELVSLRVGYHPPSSWTSK